MSCKGVWHTHQEEHNKMLVHERVNDFKLHFGSYPLVITNKWYDLCHTMIQKAHFTEKEQSEHVVKRFMIANFFLWTYPENAKLVKCCLCICNMPLRRKSSRACGRSWLSSMTLLSINMTKHTTTVASPILTSLLQRVFSARTPRRDLTFT